MLIFTHDGEIGPSGYLPQSLSLGRNAWLTRANSCTRKAIGRPEQASRLGLSCARYGLQKHLLTHTVGDDPYSLNHFQGRDWNVEARL